MYNCLDYLPVNRDFSGLNILKPCWAGGCLLLNNNDDLFYITCLKKCIFKRIKSYNIINQFIIMKYYFMSIIFMKIGY